MYINRFPATLSDNHMMLTKTMTLHIQGGMGNHNEIVAFVWFCLIKCERCSIFEPQYIINLFDYHK